MKILSREEIQRMVGRSNSRRNVAGNNQESSSQGFATPSWVDENYLSKSFFSTLFIVHATQTITVTDDQGQPVDEPTVTEITLTPNLLPGTTTEADKPSQGYTTTTVIAITSIEATKNFYSDGGVSALGQSSGGGGGGATALTDLVDVTISNPSNGQILKYNSTTNKWENANESGGGISMSDVWTALAASTSEQINASHLSETLNGYATQQWVGQQGFLTSSAISDMATKTWVGQQGYLTSSAISDMATKTWVDQNYLGVNDTAAAATKLNTARTIWGQSFDGTANITGNMEDVGIILQNGQYTVMGKNTAHGAMIESLTNTVTMGLHNGQGVGWDTRSGSGYMLQLVYDASNTVAKKYTRVYDGLRIGDGMVVWDSGNNALKVINADGTAANLYATGGVSALGMSAGVSTVDAMTFNNLRVKNSIRFASSVSVIVGNSSQIVANASDSDCIYLLNYSDSSKITSNNYYYNQYDNVGLHGTNYNYDETWFIDPDGCALFQCVYLSNNVYLYTDGSNIKVSIGSTVYTLEKS